MMADREGAFAGERERNRGGRGTRAAWRWLTRLAIGFAALVGVFGDVALAQAEPERRAGAASRPGSDERSFASRLVDAAMARLEHRVAYDGSYRRIPYPNGDVPANVGVCTDLVVRAYRALGIDLQKLVHEDMKAAFDEYPPKWGLSRPDPNIDHRRVPNLQRFFERHGEALAVSEDPADYRPGDLVTWMLPGNLPHIGIVVQRRTADGRRPLVVHNIGRGPQMEDVLFEYPVTGHYRFAGAR